jgi:hypothetical protein
MNKAIRYTMLFAVLGAGAGCASLDSDGSDSRYARLPTGVTLLDTDTARCAGAVQVREEQGGRTRESEVLLKPGENATFDVDVRDGDGLRWSCIGDTRSESSDVDCPRDTSHVRITRRAEGSDLTLECYGRRGS